MSTENDQDGIPKLPDYPKEPGTKLRVPLFDDIKSVATLQGEDKSVREMAGYYKIPTTTMQRIIQFKAMLDSNTEFREVYDWNASVDGLFYLIGERRQYKCHTCGETFRYLEQATNHMTQFERHLIGRNDNKRFK